MGKYAEESCCSLGESARRCLQNMSRHGASQENFEESRGDDDHNRDRPEHQDTCKNQAKIDEKSIENRRKSTQNRRKIDENSMLGGFKRSKPFQARAGTRSGRVRDGQKPLLERS